jgi:hypothetical protein
VYFIFVDNILDCQHQADMTLTCAIGLDLQEDGVQVSAVIAIIGVAVPRAERRGTEIMRFRLAEAISSGGRPCP